MKGKKLLLIGTLLLGLIFSSGAVYAAKKMIQIKGSDTMVNLVQILSEEFMAKNPGKAIAIMGGGSGTGIAALINGTCDIANHSRPMKSKEIELCKKKKVDPRTFIIAMDGLSVIVHKDNSLKEMVVEKIGAIYRGDITNWKEVGGPDMVISLYGRQSNSGTFVFFQEHVLGKQDYSPQMKRMNGNAQIVEGVIQDKAGIGYVGVGYVIDTKTRTVRNDLTVLNVAKTAESKAYSPMDKAAVDSGDYPVARPLFQSTNGKPEGDVALFIKFINSPEGQKIVEREGFFPIGKNIISNNFKNMK